MRKAVERAMRAIAALPVDDWQPEHHDTFEAAQAVLVDELGRLDRSRKSTRTQRARREGWWSIEAARRVVRQRSGGVCELQGPNCKGRAHDVHHAWGRLGGDPHHPSKLIHLCGFGNTDGCHGLVHSTAGGREAARARCVEIAGMGEAS